MFDRGPPGIRREPITSDHTALQPGEMAPPNITTPASRIGDFTEPWCKAILEDKNWELVPFAWMVPPGEREGLNLYWNQLLSTKRALRAAQGLRPSPLNKDKDAPDAMLMMSIGPDLEGAPGRIHGGFTATALDMVTGFAIHANGPGTPIFTGSLKVDYKSAIPTPSLALAKAWITKVEGRKLYVYGTFEDGKGTVAATADVLYIMPKAKI